MSPLGGCFGCWLGGEVASFPRSRVQLCKPLGPQSTPCILADSLAIAFAALRTQSTGCDLFRNPVDHCLFRSRSRWSVRHFVDPWRRRCARCSCAECSSPARLVPRRLRLHKQESPSVTHQRNRARRGTPRLAHETRALPHLQTLEGTSTGPPATPCRATSPTPRRLQRATAFSAMPSWRCRRCGASLKALTRITACKPFLTSSATS